MNKLNLHFHNKITCVPEGDTADPCTGTGEDSDPSAASRSIRLTFSGEVFLPDAAVECWAGWGLKIQLRSVLGYFKFLDYFCPNL